MAAPSWSGLRERCAASKWRLALAASLLLGGGFVAIWLYFGPQPVKQVITEAPTGVAFSADQPAPTSGAPVPPVHISHTISGQGDDYYPLTVARQMAHQDASLIEWIQQIAEDRQNTVWKAARGEDEITSLTSILARKSLNSANLLQLALAVEDTIPHRAQADYHEPGTTDHLIIAKLLDESTARALSEIDALAIGSEERDESIQTLRKLPDALTKEMMWKTESLVWHALINVEARGSDRQYRARYAEAGMLLESGAPADAVIELDSLIADVEAGLYTCANAKDIANLRWRICCETGQIEDGLAHLSAQAKESLGKANHFNVSVLYIDALGQVGRFDEAGKLLADLDYNRSDPSQSTTVETLVKRLATDRATISPANK